MNTPNPSTELQDILSDDARAQEKAARVTGLTPRLSKGAVAIVDSAMEAVSPLVEVALIDARFELTRSRKHKDRLEEILHAAVDADGANEELYMMARIALGRMNGLSRDRLDDWGDSEGELKMVGLETLTLGSVPSLTLIIHGTWASGGSWWRPDGDFFEFVKTRLGRADIYEGSEPFVWSGKNRGASRRKASASLARWVHSHPSTKLHIFAHSHGANIAMLATHHARKPLSIDRLVMMSPPVREDYFANWSRVGFSYNIQANLDPVVALARGDKRFDLEQVNELELEESGHSDTHDPGVWIRENVGDFVDIQSW